MQHIQINCLSRKLLYILTDETFGRIEALGECYFLILSFFLRKLSFFLSLENTFLANTNKELLVAQLPDVAHT